jgi:hypothetical protein
MNNLFEQIDGSGAVISEDGLFRYTLTRRWSDAPLCGWLCFNPSTADSSIDDASIRKMVGFSKRWGYGRLVVLNLFAIRSRDPKAVGRMGLDAIGPMNDVWINESVKECQEVICAWGCGEHFRVSKHSGLKNLDFRPTDLLRNLRASHPKLPFMCLGYREDGHPRHPLMLSYETQRIPFGGTQ